MIIKLLTLATIAIITQSGLSVSQVNENPMPTQKWDDADSTHASLEVQIKKYDYIDRQQRKADRGDIADSIQPSTNFGEVRNSTGETIDHASSDPTEQHLLIREEITRVAGEAGIDIPTAIRIAECESSLHPEASNPYSTAKGIYQFTDPTWDWIGGHGHQFDWRENIKQFAIWYPKYPSWWVCK